MSAAHCVVLSVNGWVQLCLSWIPFSCGSTMRIVEPLKTRFEQKGVLIPNEFKENYGFQGRTGLILPRDAAKRDGPLTVLREWFATAEGRPALAATQAPVPTEHGAMAQ